MPPPPPAREEEDLDLVGKKFFYAKKDEIDNLHQEVKAHSAAHRSLAIALRESDEYLKGLDQILGKYAQPDKLGSRSKLSHVMKKIGLCLITGKCHQAALPKVLKNKKMRIKLNIAKGDYTFVKYCLVHVRMKGRN